jgi:hypothetical protein
MKRNITMRFDSRFIRHLFPPHRKATLANGPNFRSFSIPKWPEFIRELPDAYRQGREGKTTLDSMTTANELILLERYAKQIYSGRGKIIDLGCWLGATSAALADGLSGGPCAQRQSLIEAFDLFEWRDWMNPIKKALGAKVIFQSGECFYNHVKNGLARYGDLVAVHKADLASYRPPEDWLIEFLFIDAMKSWELAHSIAANFFPKLMPAESLVVQQDFAFHHPTVSTNHLLMWHLRDFFKPLHHVPDSCSMVFSTEKTPSVSDIPKYSLNYFSEEDVLSAYRYCIPMVHESMRPSLMVAKLCHGLICHQRRTVTTAIEELGDRQLETGIKQTILESLKNSRSSGSAEWNEFAVRTAEKLEIKPDL